MITSKQKLALETLRDAYRICQEAEIKIGPGPGHKVRVFIFSGPDITSEAHNLSVSDLERMLYENPLATGPWISKNCYWCLGSGVTLPEQGVTYGGG